MLKSNGESFALKSVRLPQDDSEAICAIMREVHNMHGLDHPNIVQLVGHFMQNDILYLQLKLCGSTLRQHIRKDDTERGLCTILPWFEQLASALEHLHARSIMHRDISSTNIFLHCGSTSSLSLGDFGLSKKLMTGDDPSPSSSSSSDGSSCPSFLEIQPRRLLSDIGTEPYMSDELRYSNTYDARVDIYSLGVTLLETSLHPDQQRELGSIVSAFRSGDDGTIDPQLVEFIRWLLGPCDQRPTAKEILEIDAFRRDRTAVGGTATGKISCHHLTGHLQLKT